MRQNKKIKHSALLVFEKLITIGMAFVANVLLARQMGPAVFGEYMYILSMAGLFVPFCIMGLNNVVSKLVAKYPSNSHFYIKSALLIRACGAVLALLVGTLVTWLIVESETSHTSITTLLFLQCFQFLYVIEYYYLINNQSTKTLRLRLPILAAINAIKIIAILNNESIQLIVIIHGLSYLLIGLSYTIQYTLIDKSHYKQKRQISFTPLLSLFHKGKWLLLSGIAAVIYLKIDQVMLAHLVGNESVGVYAAAARLSEFWYIFPIIVANVFNRSLIDKFKESHNAFTALQSQLLTFYVLSAFIVCILTLLLGKWLIELLYGQHYQLSAEVLYIHIFATLFVFQRALFSKWLIIKKLYKYSLYTHAIGAVVNILLNLLFIPKWSVLGAAWATLISYAFASYFSLWLFKETRPFAKLMTFNLFRLPKNTQALLSMARKKANT